MMHQALYEKLKEVARAGDKIPYSELAKLVRLNRRRLGPPLEEICRYEHEQGRRMLSAVAVYKQSGIPAKPFFDLARTLGIYKGNNDLEFFTDELHEVHNYWSSH
jgi:hypothetical protein